jgi:protein gp37
MGDKSAIEWTDATWNPVTGCSKVSPGCAHCYAETVALRFWPTQYPWITPDPVVVDGKAEPSERARPRAFTDVMCHEDRLDQPLRWKKPRKVFVNSMSDLFHESVPDAFIDRVFAVMALAPRHTFQVLTKRAERMRAYLAPGQYRDVKVADAAKLQSKAIIPFALPSEDIFDARRVARGEPWQINAWPLPNVWLGVSVENQRFADERIPLLLQTPAAVRFISAEPLLGPVDLLRIPRAGQHHDYLTGEYTGALEKRTTSRLDWVIVGGESGAGARPMDLAWARSIVQQCQAAGVPVFVKQLGAKPAEGLAYPGRQSFRNLHNKKGGDPSEWPEDLRVLRQFPIGSTPVPA